MITKRRIPPILMATGMKARFFPCKIYLREIGERTSERNPFLSWPNWLNISCINPKKEKAITPTATKGFALSLILSELRRNIIALKNNIIIKFVASIILISVARLRFWKNVIASAEASSETPGIDFSRMFLRGAIIFPFFVFVLIFRPVSAAW